jgi:hypothetical protein
MEERDYMGTIQFPEIGELWYYEPLEGNFLIVSEPEVVHEYMWKIECLYLKQERVIHLFFDRDQLKRNSFYKVA